MTDQSLREFRRALADPSSRPRTANIGVGVVYAAVAALAFAVAALSGDAANDAGSSAVAVSTYALAFAAIYLIEAYGFHWHAKYTFADPSRSYVLGSVGAALGLCGLLALFVAPVIGVALTAAGAACNVLGVSWGTFVYTYRKYGPD